MPIIDLKSELRTLAERIYVNSKSELDHRRDDANRMLNFFGSAQGAIFAAKQAVLNPEDAPERIAKALAATQLSRAPFGLLAPGNSPNSSEGTIDKATQFGSLTTLRKQLNKEIDVRKRFYDKTNDIVGHRITEGEGFKEYTQPEYDPLVDIMETKRGKDRKANPYHYRDPIDKIEYVPFNFTVYGIVDGTLTSDFTLAFPAYFQNISDNTVGNWSSFKYTGRGEQFHVYQMYGRTLSLNFKVAAFSDSELDSIHKKADTLRSFAAPTYSENGYMKGTFLKLTVGDYLSLPGFVTNVSFSVDSNVPWEVEDRILPHVLSVTVAYTVIEEKTPTTNNYEQV